MNDLVKSVEEYVATWLKENLSVDLDFHSLTHTLEIVESALKIGRLCNLDDAEIEILPVAGWFHDCGYIHAYISHKEESKQIAKSFLDKYNANTELINSVLAYIEATKFPQFPQNKIEMV